MGSRMMEGTLRQHHARTTDLQFALCKSWEPSPESVKVHLVEREERGRGEDVKTRRTKCSYPGYVLDDFKLCPHEYDLFLENYPPKHRGRKEGVSRLKSYGSVSPILKRKRSSLISSGFFYSGEGNVVTCFHCGGCLSDWNDQDDPFVEHCRWFPECTFTRFVAGDYAVNYIIEEHTKLMEKLDERALNEVKPAHKATVHPLQEPEDIRFYETVGVKESVLCLAASLLPESSVNTMDDITSKVDELCRLELGIDWRTIPRNMRGSFPRMIDMRGSYVADAFTEQDRDSPQASQLPVRGGTEHVSAARYPEYADCTKRVHTFAGFPHPSAGSLKHTTLADAGLFFTGNRDETLCFQCGGKLLCWEPNDNPYNEHAKWHPSCEFIQTKLYEISLENCSPPEGSDDNEAMAEGDDEGYGSIRPSNGVSEPIANNRGGTRELETVMEDFAMSARQSPYRIPDVCGFHCNGALQSEAYAHRKSLYTVHISKPAFPRYATLASREHSFFTYPIQAKGDTEKMAKTGFFYTGYQDRTTCFQCGNSLCSWVDEDEPLVEHARWFPNCSYVELMLGVETISNVRETHRNLLEERQATEQSLSDELTEPLLRDLMRAPLVHRLLRQSIDPDIMKLAIRKRLNTTGLVDVLDEPDLRRALADAVSLPENVRTKEVSRAETGNLSKCVICTTDYRNCIFLPCCHLVACTNCAAQCSACPTCKRHVAARRNVFLA